MPEARSYRGLDLFKLIMALFVVAIHSGFLSDVNGQASFIIIQVFSRMAVPFFFIASGFFFSKGLEKRAGAEPEYLRSYAVKLLGLFAFWSAVMLPFWTMNTLRWKGVTPEAFLFLGRTLVFDPGVFWYLEALIVSALFAYPFMRRGREGLLLAFASLFYVFGVFGDSYYGLVKDLPFVGAFYKAYFSVFVHVRKGLPFGLLFFAIGHLFARREARLPEKPVPLACLLAFFLCLRYVELRLVNDNGLALDNSVSLMVVPPAVLLFLLARSIVPACSEGRARAFRSMSSAIFFSHQAALELIIIFCGLSRFFIGATARFFIAAALCLALWAGVSASRSAFLKRMINS